jgi:hypothetical protein
MQKVCMLSLSQTGWRCLSSTDQLDAVFQATPERSRPYQLELCADAFRQAWAAIVRPGCHLPKEEETRLENEISNRLCFFAARGAIDPQILQGLTVATVKFHQRAKPPLRGKHIKRHPSLVEERHWSEPT